MEQDARSDGSGATTAEPTRSDLTVYADADVRISAERFETSC